jgi:hypothetical protein
VRALDKQYYDCPQRCVKTPGNQYEATRTQLCAECPKTIKREKLVRGVEVVWEEWFKPAELADVLGFGIEAFLGQLYIASGVPEDDLTLTPDAFRFVSIYREEEIRFNEVERDKVKNTGTAT